MEVKQHQFRSSNKFAPLKIIKSVFLNLFELWHRLDQFLYLVIPRVKNKIGVKYKYGFRFPPCSRWGFFLLKIEPISCRKMFIKNWCYLLCNCPEVHNSLKKNELAKQIRYFSDLMTCIHIYVVKLAGKSLVLNQLRIGYITTILDCSGDMHSAWKILYEI